MLYKIRCESRLAGRPTKIIRSGGKSRNAGQRRHWALDGVLKPLLERSMCFLSMVTIQK